MRRLSPSVAGSRAGFTLLEVLIAVSLAGVVVVAATFPLGASYEAYRNSRRSSDLESVLRRGVDRMVTELTGAGAAVLAPDPADEFGTDSLAFRRAVGLANGAVLWGPLTRLHLEYAAGEIDDGVDNNGDGREDESDVVLTQNVGAPNESTVVLCRGVCELGEGEEFNLADDNGNGIEDERGFNIRRTGELLEIRLTTESVGTNGERVVRSLETSVILRN
jgi:prepilin-type N-terminal cleavage/methylation domain-containing protein